MKKLTDSEILELLNEYDRLDESPSEADEDRMREIKKLISPEDVLRAGLPVFHTGLDNE